MQVAGQQFSTLAVHLVDAKAKMVVKPLCPSRVVHQGPPRVVLCCVVVRACEKSCDARQFLESLFLLSPPCGSICHRIRLKHRKGAHTSTRVSFLLNTLTQANGVGGGGVRKHRNTR